MTRSNIVCNFEKYPPTAENLHGSPPFFCVLEIDKIDFFAI